MIEFDEYSDSDRLAYEARPETIAWRQYQDRSVSNARMHCEGCRRFVKPGRYEKYYNGTFDCARSFYECSHCGPMKMEYV